MGVDRVAPKKREITARLPLPKTTVIEQKVNCKMNKTKYTDIGRMLDESMGTVFVYLCIILPVAAFLTIAAAGMAVRLVW